MDINKFVNNHDLERTLSFLGFENNFIYLQSEIQDSVNEIDDLFPGDNTHAIILLNDQQQVGHWVVLRKNSEKSYTYFDCQAGPIPEVIKNIIPRKVSMDFLKVALMHPKNIICGKYCILWCMAQDLKLEEFAKILTSSKTFSADQMVDKLVRINFTDNIISPQGV